MAPTRSTSFQAASDDRIDVTELPDVDELSAPGIFPSLFDVYYRQGYEAATSARSTTCSPDFWKPPKNSSPTATTRAKPGVYCTPSPRTSKAACAADHLPMAM